MQIPPFQDEIEKVFANIQHSDYRTVAVTSANRQEGVSSMSQALAHRILLAGHSVLLVDLNVVHSSTSWVLHDEGSDTHDLIDPEIISARDSNLVFMGVRADPDKALISLVRQPKYLKGKINQWLSEFDYIVVDVPALLDNHTHTLSPDIVAGYCDACLLVVLTCSSTDRQIGEAMRKLKSEFVNVIGCVLNDHVNPSLKSELIRELERLPRWLTPVGKYLNAKLAANCFLTMEI